MCDFRKSIIAAFVLMMFVTVACQLFSSVDEGEEPTGLSPTTEKISEQKEPTNSPEPETSTPTTEKAVELATQVSMDEESTTTPEPKIPTKQPTAPPPPESCPGHENRIVFTKNLRNGSANFEIFSMNPDGSDVIQLTDHPSRWDGWPEWSPDHCRIVYDSSTKSNQRDILVMNFDGSGIFTVVSDGNRNGFPSWSPDGTRIAYARTDDDDSDLYVVNLDGSNPIQLTDFPGDEHWNEWSPVGDQIVFKAEVDGNSEIYLINADGTGLTNLTNHPMADMHPTWSPDGSKIAFTSNRSHCGEIFIMNADGSNVTQITNFGCSGLPSGPAELNWSADGLQLVFSITAGSYGDDIWKMNIDGSGIVALTEDSIEDRHTDW